MTQDKTQQKGNIDDTDEKAYEVAWHDCTLNAKHYFDQKDVSPEDAAYLLCGIRPGQDSKLEYAEWEKFEKQLISGVISRASCKEWMELKDRWDLLRKCFENAKKADPSRSYPFTLWIDIAQKEPTLHVDEWVSLYAEQCEQTHPICTKEKKKHESATDMHRREILDAIRDLGEEALRLPAVNTRPNKKDFRRLVREKVVSNTFTESAFKHTWEGLSKDGLIKRIEKIR
jgi:hypothetical protein